MSSKQDEKAQAAAERIKAATLTAAKGLSRTQAERAAAAAARNVNAYGQKEEGPSRWQERKEAKRQMYLMSTEKQVKLGVRKDLKSSIPSARGNSTQCQKCYQVGHWTYECKNERVYISRPSRTQQLKNPKLRTPLSASLDLDAPTTTANRGTTDVRTTRRRYTDSESDSAAIGRSSSVTGSGSSSEKSSSCRFSSDSEKERRMRKKKKKRRMSKRQELSSDSRSVSDSDSDDSGSRRKKRKKSRRRHSRR